MLGDMARAHFTPELFEFFRELKNNNNREWFQDHKPRFEEHVRGPIIDFINDFAPRLNKFGPCFVADSRPNGGSMFRIHRDTRFSKDKRPYKTHAAVHFRHQAGKDVHAPGFYLHLEPDNVLMGAGIWHPAPRVAQQIREHILEEPSIWKNATRKSTFSDRFVLSGESLKRKPKGVENENHPFIEDLKRKDFIAIENYDEGSACSADFLSTFTASCRVTTQFMHFLTTAVGLEYDTAETA